MKTVYALLLLALTLGGAFATGKRPADEKKEIVDLENKWAESFHTGNSEAAREFIADEFVGVSSKAARYGKAEALREIIESKGIFSSFEARDITVRIYGDAAIAQGMDVWELTDKNGTPGSSLWTDTWIRVHGKWSLVAAQDIQPQTVHPE